MCYSFKTSLFSYSIGIIAGIYALFTKQFALGLFILCFVQIQLSEIIIWYSIDTKNISLNKFGTKFGKYLLACHNIAIGFGMILSILFVSKNKLKFSDFLPLISGIILFIIINLFIYIPENYPETTYPLNKNCIDKSCQNNNNRLVWQYPHAWYSISAIMTLIIIIIYFKPFSSKMLSCFFIISTFFFSFIFLRNVIGSIWCFSAAILAPVLVLFNYFIIKNMSDLDILT
jgi:hypothetical protein